MRFERQILYSMTVPFVFSRPSENRKPCFHQGKVVLLYASWKRQRAKAKVSAQEDDFVRSKPPTRSSESNTKSRFPCPGMTDQQKGTRIALHGCCVQGQ